MQAITITKEKTLSLLLSVLIQEKEKSKQKESFLYNRVIHIPCVYKIDK